MQGGAEPHAAPGCGKEAWQFPSPALSHSLIPEGLSLLAHNSYTDPSIGQRIRRPSIFPQAGDIVASESEALHGTDFLS